MTSLHVICGLGQARRQDSVTEGGRNKIWGSMRSLFCVNSKGARGHKKFISVWIKGTRCGAKIQRDFPAEIGISSGFSGRKQVTSKKKKVFTEISRDFPAVQLVFLISSPQKTLIWASICAPKPRIY